MAERVARHFFALGFHFLDDGVNARSFGDEDVHAIVEIHNGVEAFRFLRDIDFDFGNVNAVNIVFFRVNADFGNEFVRVEAAAVFARGRGGEPAAVAPHDFVHDEHARVRGVFRNDVFEENRALFSRRPSAERLADRVNVVVDRFRQADDGEVVVVLFEECREVGSRRVRVVSADGVEDLNAVFNELVCSHFLRVFAFFDEAALHAVLDVGQLNTGIPDGATAVEEERKGFFADFRRNFDAVPEEETFVTAAIANDFDFRINFRIAHDEPADSGGKAGREPACCEDCNFFQFHNV